MKINLPVTNHEVQLRDDIMIVSKTDLKGIITYVNSDFLEVSGFSEEELIGKNHNIVRHPDMPPEGFQDLWNTLKEGRPWNGFVKNRCKNGDYYWVEANATPIFEGGRITGYLSLRRKPSRAAVDAHEQVYRLVREGKAKGLMVENGQAVSSGRLARLMRRAADMPLARKLVMASAAVLLVLMSMMTLLLGEMTAGRLQQLALTDMDMRLKLVHGLLEVTAAGLEEKSASFNRLFLSYFPEPLTAETVNGQPSLRVGATSLHGRTTEVDQLFSLTKSYSSVFVRNGEDFSRLSTSLRKENGERATDTPLGTEHPARLKLLAGKPYTGLVKMFGKDYYTRYTPIRNPDGGVIGAYFVGVDASAEMATLKKQILASNLGETGYFYVLDAHPGKNYGTLLVHPAKEGTNLLAVRDDDGHEFIREMLEKKQGLIRYPWKNAELGETFAREKIVSYAFFPTWNWVIAGGTYRDEIEAAARQMQYKLTLACFLVTFLLLAIILLLVRRLLDRPLQTALSAFRAISSGDFSTRIDVSQNDEIGRILQGLQTVQTRLGFEVAENHRAAERTQRIKVALDNVSTGVMIADVQRQIIYANPAVQAILENTASVIRQKVPDFDPKNLIGKNIDLFHTQPSHQASLLASLNGTHHAQFILGNRHLSLAASPVRGEHGERLGTVSEWRDRTAEVQVEHEMAGLVAAAQQGDFSQRLTLEGKQGFERQLAEGLNRLSEVTANGLQDVARVLQAMARGDLTESITGDYEGIFGQLKDDTNTTVERLREVVGRIQEATEAINTAAQEIAAGNQDLSGRTEEQASSLEETAASMVELNETVKNNAENATQANALARQSNEVATRGGEMVQRVVTTMSDIQASSKKIADIIGVIDSIAFQTNILALNAAVEAARAGEQGRGFAVVASEVRSLAQRSATAAKEIKTLIAESVERVEDGAGLVREAGSTMNEVVTSFRQVADLVTDISNASREQSSGIEQVTQAVSQMDEVTQQNAALVEEAAAAAESLEEQARGLLQAVSQFRLEQGRAMAKPTRNTPLTSASRSAQQRPALSSPRNTTKPAPKLLPVAEPEDEWSEF